MNQQIGCIVTAFSQRFMKHPMQYFCGVEFRGSKDFDPHALAHQRRDGHSAENWQTEDFIADPGGRELSILRLFEIGVM
jgi:hypothetical protein